MQTHYSRKDGSVQYSYRCGGYASRVNFCTSHTISADNVESLISVSYTHLDVYKRQVKAVTLKPKFLSKYYAADVPQNVIEEEIETSIDVWQKIKDKFNGLSVEEIKEQVENLLEENI